MAGVVEFHGWVPAGPLTVADLPRIDMEAKFEISDGKLEIHAELTPWHEFMTHDIEQLLAARYPTTLGDVPLAIGDDGRRPDVMALRMTMEELLRKEITVVLPGMVDLLVEVISHDTDPWRDSIAVRRDREVKFKEYAGVGVPEYWIVDEVVDDPTDASVEIYHLRDGHYVPALVSRLSQLMDGNVEPPKR